MKKLIGIFILVLAFSACQKHPTMPTPSFWTPYSQAALDQAVKDGKPVVIDFFAEWCPVCHELDDTLFSQPQVQEKLKKVVALRMDATNQDDAQVQSILQRYNIEGLPTIVFLDSHGKEVEHARTMGAISSDEFDQSLAMLDIFK